MAKRKAVVRRLSAVEALGSVSVIATDKTGTLTENRMHVRNVDSPDPERAMRTLALANDAEDGNQAGDPLELALLDFVRARGHDPTALRRRFPRQSSLPFDSSYKYMRVTVQEDGTARSYLKGAPEVLLQRSRLPHADRCNWEEKAEAYARDGFRVLALAVRDGEGEEELTFLGLVLLWDPPRPEVPGAIREALDAGIRVLMITGDHPATALAVAHEVGIPPSRVLTGRDLETLSPESLRDAAQDTNVFARVGPEHKLRLVEALKQSGDIVAMTGDGVNDAPALKRADVGVAMGLRGSDVSREVADLVLMDDNFATIIAAIEEGRGIFENIQKFNRFLFSVNVALVLLVLGGTVGSYLMGLKDEAGGLLLPLTAVQLLWINVIANGPSALALGLDRNPGVMRRPSRASNAPLLDAPSLRFIFFVGTVKALIGGALLVFLPKLDFTGFTPEATRTAVFLFESIAPLAFIYPTRRIHNSQPQINSALHLSVVLGVGIQMLAMFLPALRTLLGLNAPSQSALLIVAASVALTWGIAEVYASFSRSAGVLVRARE
jgi:Ca2+-transporting ATPase